MLARDHAPNVLLLLPAVIVVAIAVSGTGADADLWGHVRFGFDMIASGSLPAADPYSFTSDKPWINHEWLAELLMASAYRAGGSPGLVALKVSLAVGVPILVWWTLICAGVRRPAATALLVAAVLGSSYLLVTLRPQLFSAILFSGLIALLNSAARGRARLLAWVPGLFALWANLHGGWIVGALALALWGGGAWWSGAVPARWVLGSAALSALATLANPYGISLWSFLWTTVGLGRADVAEWQPLHRAPFLLLPWVLSAAVALVAWLRRQAGSTWCFLPVAALGVLSLKVARLEGFFALASILCLAPLFKGLGPATLPLTRKPRRSELTVVAVICAGALLATAWFVKGRVSCLTVPSSEPAGSWAPEPESVRFLVSNRLQGRMLTWFDYGEIAIWHLGPGLRVSFDGRRETVYSDEVQRAHWAFYRNGSDARYARALRADYAWLPRRLPVVRPMLQDGWVEIFHGTKSVVLARKAGEYDQPAARAGGSCFPGP